MYRWLIQVVIIVVKSGGLFTGNPKKTIEQMNLTYLLNLLTTIALIVPITIILFSRLLTKKTFAFLMVYYLSTFAFNLMVIEFIKVSPQVISFSAIINNLLDGPLMLSFMILLGYNSKEKKTIKVLIAVLLVYNLTVLSITGFTHTTIRISLGPSLLICLVLSIRYFIYYSRINLRRSGSDNGQTLISGALAASYSAYMFIYLIYYVFQTNPIIDAYIVYCLLTIFSVGCISIGLYKKILRWRKIEEVQLMRKELAVLYEGEKNNPNRKKARSLDDLFGFDPSEVIPGFRN